MKLFILRLSLSVSMCCAFTFAHAAPYKLEEGFYMMSASAVYSTSSDKIPTWMTVLSRKEQHYSLSFIGATKSGHIAFTVDEKGRFDIIQGRVTHGNRRQKLDGKGQLVGDNLIKGTIKRYEYFLEMPFVYTTEKSEWYLRSATVAEKKQQLIKSIEGQAYTSARLGKITREELETLSQVDTDNKRAFLKRVSRFRSMDQELFNQMLQSGELNFVYGKGFILDESLAKDVNAQEAPPPPISSKVKKRTALK